MSQLKCKITSGIGKIYSLNKLEITSLDETFPFINRNKYIGLSVQPGNLHISDIIYIAHHSIVENSFKQNRLIQEEDRVSLQTTANWILPYEKTCLTICKDILGIKLANKTLYSMDLPRFLEKIIEEKMLKKENI